MTKYVDQFKHNKWFIIYKIIDKQHQNKLYLVIYLYMLGENMQHRNISGIITMIKSNIVNGADFLKMGIYWWEQNLPIDLYF